jgi:hypothetical protein
MQRQEAKYLGRSAQSLSAPTTKGTRKRGITYPNATPSGPAPAPRVSPPPPPDHAPPPPSMGHLPRPLQYGL